MPATTEENRVKRDMITRIAALALAVVVALGCAPSSQDNETRPPTRDGLFYLNFAEARNVAQAENKMMLVEFWRPN